MSKANVLMVISIHWLTTGDLLWWSHWSLRSEVIGPRPDNPWFLTFFDHPKPLDTRIFFKPPNGVSFLEEKLQSISMKSFPAVTSPHLRPISTGFVTGTHRDLLAKQRRVLSAFPAIWGYHGLPADRESDVSTFQVFNSFTPS